MKSRIKKVMARQILDSRGNPAIFAQIELNCGIKGAASVPSGASVGKYEALELRDNEKNVYFGRGVLCAVNNVNAKISKILENKSVIEQRSIDYLMIEADGEENKSNFGANAILSVSLAAARAASALLNIPLYKYLGGIYANITPIPLVNIINGGVHAGNGLDFQEFMIVPLGAETFSSGVRMCAEIFWTLKNILKKKGYNVQVGDEGGFAPDLKTSKEALDLILEAIKGANYSLSDVKIALDTASSEFYDNEKYILKNEKLELTSEDMLEYLVNLTENYPIISIEDGMAQNDYSGWQILTEKLGKKILLVGDDLFATNSKLLKEGIKTNLANSILIKPNQIGTLTETLDTFMLAQKSGYKTIISHRSGETEDTFISDLAVGLNAGFIKTGSISRGERICKYNRLLEIEYELNLKLSNLKGSGAIYNNCFENFSSTKCV
ncbi:MAG: phosphopyruvate hydratase [Candidatus Gastranaerophilales bacterium]|nr:phosphopyruvate hydratase [Candidatus Gastranaerophilales bacterium]